MRKELLDSNLVEKAFGALNSMMEQGIVSSDATGKELFYNDDLWQSVRRLSELDFVIVGSQMSVDEATRKLGRMKDIWIGPGLDLDKYSLVEAGVSVEPDKVEVKYYGRLGMEHLKNYVVNMIYPEGHYIVPQDEIEDSVLPERILAQLGPDERNYLQSFQTKFSGEEYQPRIVAKKSSSCSGGACSMDYLLKYEYYKKLSENVWLCESLAVTANELA